MRSQFHLSEMRCGHKSGNFTLMVNDLVIRPRRLNLLTGPNGCGKSTLLMVLAFLKQPMSGQVTFGDRLVQWSSRNLHCLRQRVTLVEQNPYFFRGTVATNVDYGLKLLDIRGDVARKAVADALALVSLSGFEQRDVSKLSGGEARRVAIARALALKPEVLLLDEPLANLDLRSAAVVERVVAALADLGTTVVMSTHDRSIAERLDCDIIRLLDGRVDYASEVEICRPLMMPVL